MTAVNNSVFTQKVVTPVCYVRYLVLKESTNTSQNMSHSSTSKRSTELQLHSSSLASTGLAEHVTTGHLSLKWNVYSTHTLPLAF